MKINTYFTIWLLVASFLTSPTFGQTKKQMYVESIEHIPLESLLIIHTMKKSNQNLSVLQIMNGVEKKYNLKHCKTNIESETMTHFELCSDFVKDYGSYDLEYSVSSHDNVIYLSYETYTKYSPIKLYEEELLNKYGFIRSYKNEGQYYNQYSGTFNNQNISISVSATSGSEPNYIAMYFKTF